MLFYRRDLLEAADEKPPETFDELVRIAQKLQRPPQLWGYVWQGKQYEGLICDFMEVLTGFGGFWINSDTNEVGLDRPEAVRALEWMRDAHSPRRDFTAGHDRLHRRGRPADVPIGSRGVSSQLAFCSHYFPAGRFGRARQSWNQTDAGNAKRQIRPRRSAAGECVSPKIHLTKMKRGSFVNTSARCRKCCGFRPAVVRRPRSKLITSRAMIPRAKTSTP